ncbi:unnamed protein product [Ostreobium quekettii]|uniref:Secreted protein n=1 Tax=Ostreobium quekettii TaxID=121088 RepID=A0A8S1ILQ9_9CHLO|nr:unnamed protein product [Ostreobium quekettii]
MAVFMPGTFACLTSKCAAVDAVPCTAWRDESWGRGRKWETRAPSGDWKDMISHSGGCSCLKKSCLFALARNIAGQCASATHPVWVAACLYCTKLASGWNARRGGARQCAVTGLQERVMQRS